jgi:oxalate decarboxylase
MTPTDRRTFLGGLALAAGTAAATPVLGKDGRAAGYDVAPAFDHMPLIPRKSGDPVIFTASLDKAPIKATSGGAEDVMTNAWSHMRPHNSRRSAP